MFTPEEREKIRLEIVEIAKQDRRLGGGAITGSASIDKLDSYSDIDLAFGVLDTYPISDLVKDYTERMYRDYGVLHHMLRQ